MNTHLKWIGIALIALPMAACQKEKNREVVQPAANADQALIAHIEKLTDKYIAAGSQEKRPTQDQANGVLRDDLNAHMRGATGANYLEVLGQATANGACDSYFEFIEQYRTVEPPTPLNPVVNSHNPYEYVGEQHYDIMAQVVGDPSIALVNGEVSIWQMREFTLTQLEDQYPDIWSYQGCTVSSLQATLNVVQQVTNETQFINALPYSSTEKQIMVSYMNAYENITSGAQFAAYSISVESSILSGNLPTVSKARLLSLMAVGRHGAAFYGWN
jgi:hypothetical protein